MRRALAALGGLLLSTTVLVAAPATAQPQRGPRVVAGDGTDAPGLVTRLVEGARRGKPAELAVAHLSANRSLYEIDAPAANLDVIDVQREGGRSTVRLGQLYRGVEVFGAQYLVHFDERGAGREVTAVNGHYFTELNTSVEPRISEHEAEMLAVARLRSIDVDRVERHGLVVLPNGDGVTAFHFSIWGRGPKGPVKQETFISARTGAPVLSYNDLHLADPVLGRGVTAHGDTVDLNVFHKDDLTYELRALLEPPVGEPPPPSIEPVQILTHDAGGNDGNTFQPTDATVVNSSTPMFEGIHSNSGAVDAHWGAERVFEFYKGLGRNSIDDEGGDIVSVVNAGGAGGAPMYNAFWDGTKMVYGNPEPGPGSEVYPFSADLDIVAHELTHGVIDFTADLVYLNQSGAMNEAYADYFGNAADVSVTGTPMDDPQAGYIAEDLCRVAEPDNWDCPLRDMNDGTTTDDYVFYLVDFDNGGVHLNSTVFSGALWDVREGLDPAVADQIMYRALTMWNTPLDDFIDGRNAVLGAADELHANGDIVLTPEQRQIIVRAFESRGIVPSWDDGAGHSDAKSLIEDVVPLGFYFAAPQVSGARFVVGNYSDKETMFDEPQDIVVGNVSGNGAQTVMNASGGNALYDEQPDISGKQVVWAHGSIGGGGVAFDVLNRKLGKGMRTIASTSNIEWFPSIDGNLVAWESFNGSQTDIWARRIGRLPKRMTRSGGDELFPQVFGTKIAWWDLGGGGRAPRLRIKDFKSLKKVTIKHKNPDAYLGPPALNDTHVFWFQDVNDDGIGSIMRAKHNGKRKKALVKASDTEVAPVYQGITPEAPRLSANEDFVVYPDEYGYARASDPGYDREQVGRDVWIVPVTGGIPRLVTCNRGDQAYPSIGDGERAAWLDGSLGRTDLMTRAKAPLGCRRGG